MGEIVYLVLKLCLFFKKSLIKKFCLHTSEIFSEACSMSILYPQKIVLFYLINFLRKLIFSVCEDRQIFFGKSKMYAHAEHKHTIFMRVLSIRLQLVRAY